MPFTLNQIANALGYIQVFSTHGSSMIAIINNPDTATAERNQARTELRQDVRNIAKLLRTMLNKETIQAPAEDYTDQELADFRIL